MAAAQGDELGGTIATSLLRGLIEAANRVGIAGLRCAKAVGIDTNQLDTPDRRYPRSVLRELMVALDEAWGQGNKPLGVALAEAGRPGDFQVLDYAIRNSQTLGEAYHRLTRYHRLLYDTVSIRLEPADDGTSVLYYSNPSPPTRSLAEYAMATFTVAGRQITNVPWNPREVHFQHAAPNDTEVAKLQAFFGVRPRFGEARNALVLTNSDLDIPVHKADSRLAEVLDRYADKLLAGLPASDTLVSAVRREVAAELRGGDPGQEAIASRLRMSSRTLQRRLKEEGTSFREIVDALRRELAGHYLAEHTMAIDEIAFLLGYSEASAFHRAFKKWEGKTPHAYRLEARGQA